MLVSVLDRVREKVMVEISFNFLVILVDLVSKYRVN